MATKRVNFSLRAETDQQIDRLAQACLEHLGRRNPRSDSGGWRSEIVRLAVEQFDVEAFISRERERKAA